MSAPYVSRHSATLPEMTAKSQNWSYAPDCKPDKLSASIAHGGPGASPSDPFKAKISAVLRQPNWLYNSVRFDPAALFDIEKIDHRTRKRGDCIAPPKFAKNRKGRDFREFPKIFNNFPATVARRAI
jgi:hypothetical protein